MEKEKNFLFELDTMDAETYEREYINILVDKNTKFLDVINFLTKKNKCSFEIELEEEKETNIINFVK